MNFHKYPLFYINFEYLNINTQFIVLFCYKKKNPIYLYYYLNLIWNWNDESFYLDRKVIYKTKLKTYSTQLLKKNYRITRYVWKNMDYG